MSFEIFERQTASGMVVRAAALMPPPPLQPAFRPDWQDADWMARALQLAALGLTTTTPNPRVGCVLVRDGQWLADGWHQRAGEGHAEVQALRALQAAGGDPRGATAYVTLEPCSHTGRTGPCCQALAVAGVHRVVVAMTDPNPQVAGRGLLALQAAGIAVTTGVGSAAAARLNAGFISRMERGQPWVRLKVGMSLDGRTALGNGISQWITGAAARLDVHRLRAEACAVLTGTGTLRADDPQLDVRGLPVERQPLRVLIDATLSAPPAARMLQGGAVVLAAAPLLAQAAVRRRADVLEGQGVQVIGVPASGRYLDLAAALQALGGLAINDLLVEAGSRLNAALLAAGLVDECIFYLAPRLLGEQARGPAALGPFIELQQAFALRFGECCPIGADLRIQAFPSHLPF